LEALDLRRIFAVTFTWFFDTAFDGGCCHVGGGCEQASAAVAFSLRAAMVPLVTTHEAVAESKCGQTNLSGNQATRHRYDDACAAGYTAGVFGCNGSIRLAGKKKAMHACENFTMHVEQSVSYYLFDSACCKRLVFR